MLDKIININTDVRLQSEDKSSRYNRFGKKKGNSQVPEKDSLVFSPAASYLSELDWELHHLDYPAEDKVSLEFVIDDFLFRMIIDFSNYWTTLSQSIYISHQMKRKNISIIMSLAKRKLWFIEHYQHIKFTGIESLFERIFELSDENNEVDDLKLEEELIELEIKLNSEMQYILASVFTFLDKLGKFKIIKKFQFNNNSKELVKIEKVKVQNAR